MLKIFSYESWAAFIAASRKPSEMPDKERVSLRTNREDFIGCSLANAHKMADEGWIEGAEQARRFTDLLCDAIGGQIDRPVVNYDVEGHNIDVARYLDNEPECWQKFEVERMQQPAVKYLRLTINICVSGAISTRTILGRGSVAAALVELLEFAGNRVEVEMQECSNGYNGLTALTRCIVKRFDEPLDLPKIAYVLAHPSTLRVHQFSMMETEFDAQWRDAFSVGSGYGMPTNVPKEYHGDIHLDRMLYGEAQWTDAASAERYVRAELKKFGVTLHENTPAL